MKKRILSILLLCCMVLTLLPTAAFAAGELPDVKLSVPTTFDKTVDLTKQNGELKIKDSKTYLIKGSTDPNWYFQHRIKIDGKNNTPHIFLDGVRLQAPKDGPAIELYNGASACLYFIGNDSELIGAENFAALQKNKTDGHLRVLVQTGTKLTCEGGRYGAGIGGSKVGIKKFSQGHGMNLHFGSLATNIYGGEILATSGVYGAGIGGGQGGVGEWIYVYSGKLTVRSVSEGAGIGGGQGGPGRFIYIKGGTVNAGSESGGAGIGSGDQDGQNKSEDAHHIEISGGTVEAWSNYAGAGIGGGRGGSGYDISITGGVVRAQGYLGAGIGGGMNGNSGNILIKDTTLTALAFPLYQDYGYTELSASAVGRGSNRAYYMAVMQDQEFAMIIEENIKIGASDGKSVQLSATGWQWRHNQEPYKKYWGTTTELLIPNENGRVDLQRLSLPYAYNYGRVISKLELRCEESTCSHEFGWVNRDGCHIWACVNCGARDPAAEMSKQNAKHIPGDWGNQKQLCTVCGHVMGTDTKAPVLEGLKDGESYTVEDNIDGNPGAYTFTVSDPAASGETSSGIKSVTINGEPQDGPTYRLPAPDGGNNDAGAEYTVVATDNAGNETTATVRTYRWHHTVTFDANGGSEPEDLPEEVTTAMPAKKVLHGSKYYLPECEFVAPEGKQFKAWEIDGTEYKVSATVTVTADITAKALWEDAPPAPSEYTVTVTTAGKGTASADPAKAVAGEEITLTAKPDEDYRFKEWKVESPAGLVITNNKFTMPDSNVEVKAIFEEDAPPAPTEYTVTVTTVGNGMASASPDKAVAGTEITLSATPNGGYRFKEWKVIGGGVTIKDNKFTMPEDDVTIEAIFEKDAPSAEDLVDPVIRIIPSKHGGYPAQGGTRTAADFFKPGEAPKGAKITAITPPASPSILDSISVDNDGLLSYAKNEADGEQLKTDVYTVTITSDDYAPITAPLTVRQYLFAGFTSEWNLRPWVYGDTRTYKWKVLYPGENGTWSAVMREQGIFEVYEETVDTTSEPGVSHYTTKVRAIKAGQTFIDILYVSDTTAAWSPWSGSDVVAGGWVFTRTLTVTAGSATITKGDALPTDLVTCTGLLDSEGRTDDRDTVLDNALGYQLLDASNEEVTAATARNTPGTYTVVPTAALKSGWDERYSLNRVNGTLTVEDKVEEQFTVTVTSGGNGTASASHVKAVAGTEITLTATPKEGYHFKEWEVISGGVTIKDDKFIMPSTNVEVKAIFEKDAPPAPTEFIVTFDGNGGTPSVGSMTTTNQKLTSLPSASRRGSYSFDGWYTDKSGGTKITTATVFSANTTVYAHWTYIGGGGGYNPPVTYYTLRFETGGGSDIPSVREAYNTYIDLTKYVPTWRGHTFIGWYTERSLINKVSGVYLTKDMTVYALWRVDENPGTGANPFTDVSEKDWFYGDVMFVYENGLMLGTSKTLFSPHGTATRGMMATILWRMEGSPAPKGKNSFTDVEAGKWYADAITWTAENGIFAGYGKDKFGPDDPITREQLAAIFYRYADYKGYDLTVKGNLDKFKDADKITDYAKTAMQWAVGSGLVKGKSGNLLDPQGTATRAEIAAMLHRFIEKYELVQGKAPGGLMGWIDPKRLQIPKTGDSSVLGLWGISLCTSLAGCLALTTWQIRRRREEESLQIIEK